MDVIMLFLKTVVFLIALFCSIHAVNGLWDLRREITDAAERAGEQPSGTRSRGILSESLGALLMNAVTVFALLKM